MIFIDHINGGDPFAWIERMAGKVGAHQLAVPWPLVLGIGRGVNAHVAAPSLNVAFESRLLLGVEYVAGGAVKHYGLVVF